MAESAVLLALKTIGNLLIEEGKFLHGLKDEVLQLQRELKWMKLFLEDADENMIDDKTTIQECILEVKDVAYDAGYLLEDYAFKVGSRTMDGGFLDILRRSACIFNDSYPRHKIRSEIQALNTRILNLKNNFQAYGLRDIMEKEGSSCRKQLLRRTYSFVEEEDFVGLQDHVDLLVKHLVSEDDVRVVSIWGMGGLGKTTLANKVYKHPTVKRYFNRFAWICVSQQWQTKDILQRIMIKLLPEKKDEIKKLKEDELIPKLFKIQQECKCLIVLDDIWTEEAWESIKIAFPSNERGSKILLTTRKREVAMHIGPDGFHHQPRLLSDDESWDLLKRKALPERYDEGDCNNTQLNEVEELGKKMVKYCGGLPLAVVVLGGILLANNTLKGWAKVNEDIKSYLWKQKGIGKGKGELERILALSYYDLPFQLKPCFLYLSAFPEDTDIEAETLCQMWIAEGMVLTEDRVGEETMMELAERYLGELGQRGVVQLGTLRRGGWGYGYMRYRRTCRLHDLMRDLCLRKAEEESFLKCINYSSEEKDAYASLSESSTCKLRRLVINLDSNDVCRYVPPKKEITKYIQMLQFVVNGRYEGRMARAIESQLNNFEMLHVLFIEGLDADHEYGWKVPKAIGKLIHLRYLSFEGSFLGTLPSSLGNLKYLQTLDLRVYQFQVRIPNILWNMKELTCLYLPFDLRRCKRVRLDGLNELEILENFDDKYCYIEDLLKLNNLRVLTISKCVEFENLEMIANYAESSNKLQLLSIRDIWCDLYSEKEKGLRVLKQLLFGRKMHSLGIWGQLWKFPKFESNMSSSLVRLDILSCGLDAEEVISGTLEKLTHLRILTLRHMLGKEMVFHAMGFPQLRELYLYHFFDLEKWVVEEGAMPNLRTLLLRGFDKLEEIPNGFQFLVNFEKLHILDMSQKFSKSIGISDKISHVSLVTIDEP